jgi:hypothetical protein
MESGELSEFDDGAEPYFHDFLEWYGLYKIWLKREQAYRELLQQQPLPDQLRRALATSSQRPSIGLYLSPP